MSETYQASLPKWIRLKKYAEISGVTGNAFHIKKNQGHLAEGVHWIKAPDGNIMVNWSAMDKWVENGY